MDEMMKGQRGWRELTELGEKGNKISGMLEGIIWSPKGGDSDHLGDGWETEEVKWLFCFFMKKHYFSGVWICGDYLFWREALK